MPISLKKKINKSTVEILNISLEEQRRFHDELTKSFAGLRNKIIYYIGALLALFTFLYSSASDKNLSVQKRLFLPDELYGVIFYVFGFLCLVYALVILVRGARPDALWEYPTDLIESDVVNKVNPDIGKEEFLQRLVDEYEVSTKHNLDLHNKKKLCYQGFIFSYADWCYNINCDKIYIISIHIRRAYIITIRKTYGVGA